MEDDELRTREFNRITDRYLTLGVMSSEDYAGLTARQRDCIQWVKRAVERLKRITPEDDSETN